VGRRPVVDALVGRIVTQRADSSPTVHLGFTRSGRAGHLASL